MEFVVVLLLSLCAMTYYICFFGDPKDLESLEKETLKTDEELMDMTKQQIEEYAREHGIELDRRKTKANMIKEFRGKL